MKTAKTLMLLLGATGFLLSCDYGIYTETVVHSDGSLDRTITLDEVDSSDINNNYFGINQNSAGWETTVKSVRIDEDTSSMDNREKIVISFSKHFDSWQESNEELSSPVDSLFKIESTFEKRFRWFYTYLYYADTYKAIDRFYHISQEDYFTSEDYAFIDRLPAEGKEISKADNYYLEALDEKIFEHYASRGIFEDQFHILISLIENHGLGQHWLDTLEQHKEPLYNVMLKNDDGMDVAIEIADSLGIPLPNIEVDEDYITMIADFQSRLNFMSEVGDGNYTHSITMPWTLVSTNADSIAGSHLIWQPPVTKFLLKDYEMYAEARKMNYWAVIVSVLIVLLSLFLLVRRRN